MTIQLEYDSNFKGSLANGKIFGKGVLNLVDGDILDAASNRILDLYKDENLRCLILEGETKDAFIGGADLKVLRVLDSGTAESFIRSIHNFCNVIRNASFPVIAKMRGYCLGAGLEIAAACDIRLADESVKCGMPEVRIGVPSVVEAALLPGLIGWGKAREMMLRGNIFEGKECYAMGLVQQLYTEEKLKMGCENVCKDILLGNKNAISNQKKLFLDWEERFISSALERGVEVFVEAYGTSDPRVMIEKFFAKE